MPLPGNDLVIKQLDVELNGGCNYTCQMCPQAFGREKDFLRKLPFAQFEKSMDDALQYGLECVSLHGSGEPTLNADMPEFVRAVKARGLKCVSFTNGAKLNEALSTKLIDAGIDILRISAIGYDRESYHKWMSKDLFEQVRNNVRRFVEINREKNASSEVHLYHLVTDIKNQDSEVAAYHSNWVDFTGALAEIWLMHNWSGDYDGPYDRSNMVTAPVKRSCGRPFAPELQVRAGGLNNHRAGVVACCMVLGKDSQAVLGHLDTNSIREVVESEAFEELRSAHREGRFDDIPYCKDCDQLYNMPNALVWSNIPDRKYGESKVVTGLDYRVFAQAGV
jgi:organic radical activating enzyme